jgi:hypothetical protein
MWDELPAGKPVSNDVDYSKLKSIADEPHWNEFVQSVGGELVAPLIKRQGVKSADYETEQEDIDFHEIAGDICEAIACTAMPNGSTAHAGRKHEQRSTD